MTAPTANDLPEKRWGRAYTRELTVVLLGYFLLLALSNLWLDRVDGNWRYAIVLLPIVACAGLPVVIARMHDRVDERQREQMRNAILHSFAGTALITFAYGFLEEAGAPRQSMFWVWGLMGALVLVSTLVQHLRDR